MRHWAASSIVSALGQDAPSDRDHRIGGKDQSVLSVRSRLASLVLGRQRLEVGKPLSQPARQFTLVGCLVDIGGDQVFGLDADLIQQGQPARRGRSQNEFGDGAPCGIGLT